MKVKPHQCQQCLKSFSSNHQLVQHIRSFENMKIKHIRSFENKAHQVF